VLLKNLFGRKIYKLGQKRPIKKKKLFMSAFIIHSGNIVILTQSVLRGGFDSG